MRAASGSCHHGFPHPAVDSTLVHPGTVNQTRTPPSLSCQVFHDNNERDNTVCVEMTLSVRNIGGDSRGASAILGCGLGWLQRHCLLGKAGPLQGLRAHAGL